MWFFCIFFIAHEKGFKFQAQPQTGAYSCYLKQSKPKNVYCPKRKTKCCKGIKKGATNTLPFFKSLQKLTNRQNSKLKPQFRSIKQSFINRTVPLAMFVTTINVLKESNVDSSVCKNVPFSTNYSQTALRPHTLNTKVSRGKIWPIPYCSIVDCFPCRVSK